MTQAAEVWTELEGRRLKLTHLDKVLYPDTGWTKGEVIAHMLEFAPVILPHLAGRPLTRVRFPHGVGGESFFEKNPPPGCPPWIRRLATGEGTTITDHLVAEEPATLVQLANLAALELHVPQWRAPEAVRDADSPAAPIDLDGADAPRSTTMVVDLDPGAGLSASAIAEAAMLAGGMLATDGFTPLVKSSGSKGLQLYAAIAPTPAPQVVAYVRELGLRLQQHAPTLFVTTMKVSERAGRVYVDHLQNLAQRTTIAPWSLRGRHGRPTVSLPLDWDQVATISRHEDLLASPEQAREQLATHGDLFAELLSVTDAPPVPVRD